jgi:hypothetical protein
MKQSFLLATVVASLALSSCAQNPQKSVAARAPVDKEKVIAVDDWAKDAHATVMWVNYPQAPSRSSHDD